MYHEARLCSSGDHTGACRHLLMCVSDTHVECPLQTRHIRRRWRYHTGVTMSYLPPWSSSSQGRTGVGPVH